MRIVIVGTSGSGKSTLARAIAAAFGLSHVELDALHWGPGWEALSRTDPQEFIRRVDTATAGAAWVADGNYVMVRDLVWRRATHLIWLDYARPVIMLRVLRRSLTRAVDQSELYAGNREDWRRWFRPSHPIRWAWSTWPRRRAEYSALVGRDEYAHLHVLRLQRPGEAARVIERLRAHSAGEL
jgi:adenylate kinase family enzyme